MADLDLRAGRAGDAAAHLREGLQIAVRTGSWVSCSTAWTAAGPCAPRPGATPRPSRCGPRSAALHGSEGITDPPCGCASREEQLREARQALEPGRARAAEDRGAAMSLATAAEYALMLTAPARRRPRRRARGSSAPGNGSWSPWSPRAAPTPRSPPSCTSASAPSAPTWTGSGTRPAAAAAPT